ncbi:MAG: AAA family ATPase, partial [Azoarcus sp.]|nr:AAA family ATPase [Azoarcus sp.]
MNFFSGLNNLADITLSPDFSNICGYTDADVDTVFAPELEGLDRDKMISAFEVGDISTEALMFQSGYLTLTGEENLGDEIFYTLGFPNREVRSALNKSLLGAWIGSRKREGEHRIALFRALQENDFSRIREIFFSLY